MGQATGPKELIGTILSSHFARQVKDVTSLSRKGEFIYKVSLEPQEKAHEDDGAKRLRATQKPGTELLPAATTEVALRFTNPDAGLNDAVVVENQVAAMALFRSALGELVPKVYGWQSVTAKKDEDDTFSGRGWIVQEVLPGVTIGAGASGDGEDRFGSLSHEAKQTVLDQLASIVQRIQSLELPASVKGYGGLAFAEDGSIVTGPTAIYGAKTACTTFHELYTQTLKTQLEFMDRCDVVQGWKNDGNLRARIDKFVAEGFQARLAEAIEEQPRPTLVHGDLNLHNVLFDPTSLQITGLLDMEFSHVASACDEYFLSFTEIQSHFPPPHHPIFKTLRTFLLQGPSDNADAGAETATDGFDPELAKQTYAAFSAAGVTKPSDLKSIDKLSGLHYFIQNVSPGLFFLENVRSKMTISRAAMFKKMIYGDLDETLADWGY